MCIFSKPKTPAPPVMPATPAPPPMPPPPTPTPEVASQVASDSRKKRLEQLQYGLASTIKTGARGLTGTGADLKSSGFYGKSKLGA